MDVLKLVNHADYYYISVTYLLIVSHNTILRCPINRNSVCVEVAGRSRFKIHIVARIWQL